METDPSFEKLQEGSTHWLSTHCGVVASALRSSPSHLRELDLSGNYLEDSRVKRLCDGLKSPHCHLETLRLKGCGLTTFSFAPLASALKTNPSHLRHLDLSSNELQDSGVETLSGFLQSPNCHLETLRMSYCYLSRVSRSNLTFALKAKGSHHLTELDLSYNNLGLALDREELCALVPNVQCEQWNLDLVNLHLVKT